MLQKIKLGFWMMCPVIIGIFTASSLLSFFEHTETTTTPQISSVIVAVTEQKEIKQPDFVKIIFGGDLMLDRGVRNSVLKNFGGDYTKLFKNLEKLKEADIVFANLEGTASDKGKNGGGVYSFRMDPEIISVIKNAGINILSVANNHIGDWNREAYIDTLKRLKENEILYTGGGHNKAEAETPVIIEKYEIKIGFLAFSDVGPDWMESKADRAGQLIARDPRFDEIIQNASALVDYLVVSFHFGDEYKPTNNPRQKHLAHKAIDNGAKIVIGHHPHVIQNTEIYKDGFIAYSLGNFIFDQSWSEPTMQGMLLEMKLSSDGGISVKKNIFKLNKFFQIGEVIEGEEEKVKFGE